MNPFVFTKEQYLETFRDMYPHAMGNYATYEPAKRAKWLLRWLCPSIQVHLLQTDAIVLETFVAAVSLMMKLIRQEPTNSFTSAEILMLPSIREPILSRVGGYATDRIQITGRILNGFLSSLPVTPEGRRILKEYDTKLPEYEHLRMLYTHSVSADDIAILGSALTAFVYESVPPELRD